MRADILVNKGTLSKQRQWSPKIESMKNHQVNTHQVNFELDHPMMLWLQTETTHFPCLTVSNYPFHALKKPMSRHLEELVRTLLDRKGSQGRYEKWPWNLLAA